MNRFVVQRQQRVVGQLPPWIKQQLPITNMPTIDRRVLQNDLQQYDQTVPLYNDSFMNELTQDDFQQHIDGMYQTPDVDQMRYGFSGLGATPVAPVTVTPDQPVKPSTMLAVVGGSFLAVAASVALWALVRKK